MLFFWPNVKKCSNPTQSISKHLQQLQIPSVFRISWDSIMVQPVVQTRGKLGSWHQGNDPWNCYSAPGPIPPTKPGPGAGWRVVESFQVRADFTKDNGDIGVHFPNLQKGGRKDEENAPINGWSQQIFDNSESSQLKKDLHAYLDLTVARVGFQDMFVRILQDNCNQVYNKHLAICFFAHRFARTQWRW